MVGNECNEWDVEDGFLFGSSKRWLIPSRNANFSKNFDF